MDVILVVVFPGDLSSINAELFVAELRAELAVLLGVDPSQITIVLRSGSIVADVTVAVGSASEKDQVESRVSVAARDETELSLLVDGQGHTAVEFGLVASTTTTAADLKLATSESDDGSDSAAAAIAAVLVCIVLAASIAAFVVIRQRRQNERERKPEPGLVVENTAAAAEFRPLNDHGVAADADTDATAGMSGGMGFSTFSRSDSYGNALDKIDPSPAIYDSSGIGGTEPQYEGPTELPAPVPLYAPLETIEGTASGAATDTVEVFQLDPKTNSVRLRSIVRSNPSYRDSVVEPVLDQTPSSDDSRSEI